MRTAPKSRYRECNATRTLIVCRYDAIPPPWRAVRCVVDQADRPILVRILRCDTAGRRRTRAPDDRSEALSRPSCRSITSPSPASWKAMVWDAGCRRVYGAGNWSAASFSCSMRTTRRRSTAAISDRSTRRSSSAKRSRCGRNHERTDRHLLPAFPWFKRPRGTRHNDGKSLVRPFQTCTAR